MVDADQQHFLQCAMCVRLFCTNKELQEYEHTHTHEESPKDQILEDIGVAVVTACGSPFEFSTCHTLAGDCAAHARDAVARVMRAIRNSLIDKHSPEVKAKQNHLQSIACSYNTYI